MTPAPLKATCLRVKAETPAYSNSCLSNVPLPDNEKSLLLDTNEIDGIANLTTIDTENEESQKSQESKSTTIGSSTKSKRIRMMMPPIMRTGSGSKHHHGMLMGDLQFTIR
tara:strand:- start:39 stop:371 length:333 start_codon:yes stop_codon:yes gene_type:complete